MGARTVAAIQAEIAEHDAAAATRRKALQAELSTAQRSVRFECDACHRAVKVGEAVVIQDLEFRCPGQTGGYFINAGRRMKCPYCGGTTNPYNQPEIDALPNSVFASVEEKEL
ncbi:UNVERIFIED_CONTAM: hypothetical protein Q9R58_04185 [Methylobacteriaceae bacterium AG10]|nr:hypothetical protein [Methylobacteriaceae bacterium AG10]